MTDAPATPPAGADAPGCDMAAGGLVAAETLAGAMNDRKLDGMTTAGAAGATAAHVAANSPDSSLSLSPFSLSFSLLSPSESPFSSEAMTADAVVGHGTFGCSATTGWTTTVFSAALTSAACSPCLLHSPCSSFSSLLSLLSPSE